MAGALTKQGVAGVYGLVFGATYLAVAILEQVLGNGGLTIGGGDNINEIILLQSGVHNAVHFATGGLLVVGALVGAAKPVARVVGIVFTLVTALGLLLPGTVMDLLGYGDGLSVPIAYTAVHALTAVTALYAGFVSK